MLSGGERALTAVSLLFALLQTHPSPFCVLDEVDAMLDESNVGRFVDALRRLAERTQFIIITHNRRTIEVADAIYGISMTGDSTRVLSLRSATPLPAPDPILPKCRHSALGASTSSACQYGALPPAASYAPGLVEGRAMRRSRRDQSER
jgi:hypothetical protein